MSFEEFRKTKLGIFLAGEWMYNPKSASMDEILIKKIINSALERDTEKLHSPSLDEYFIIDRKNQIYICISDNNIRISNHDFHYNKQFNLKTTTMFKDIVRVKIDMERDELKKELFRNEIDLLHKINEL